MSAGLEQRVRRAFLSSPENAPISLHPYFRAVTHELDGLETALFAIAQGLPEVVPERMDIWHPDLAAGGYRSWAQAYLARAEAACESELPDELSALEQQFLAHWRNEVLNLINDSAATYESAGAP
jgi:hypothetical protein